MFGFVSFPKKGAENLIQQLVGFGIERHDDLADAFSILVLKIQEGTVSEPGIKIISLGSIFGNSGEGDLKPITMDMKF